MIDPGSEKGVSKEKKGFMTKTQKNHLPPCLIYIDKEGLWYHEGIEMIHREFIRLFFRNMEMDSQGRYVITWNGERCYVEVEDTAFVVRRVVCQDEAPGQNARFVLYLSDDTKEVLLPDTLFVGQDNVIYCKVKNRAFPARFNRTAYYQLAEYIEEEDKAYYLQLSGRKYNIAINE
jgi:hypothetical protein